MATCRHCREPIKPCNCGANYGRPHWIDRTDSRYCARSSRLHEPERV